ncbi:MAG: ABC transporter ATP-binding protein [Chloroflexi bacterium]|nr:ABC transporter ATP-binding protein [Chloroflexota bacterium]
MSSAIHLDQISKKLGNRLLLNNVSFNVEPGDIFGYLGPNGAGKTSTIRVILGLFKPNSGNISILGDSISSPRIRQSIGFVLENDGLYDNLTAFENLSFYCRLYHLYHNAKKIEDMIELVELSERAHDRVGTFSKGMRQKLALARAMVHDPELLILDEPTSGVDPTGQIEVRNIILNMAHQRGKTIFLSSHNLDEVQRVCSNIALIDKGEIKIQGSLNELRNGSGKYEISIETDALSIKKQQILDETISELNKLSYIKHSYRKMNYLYLQMTEYRDISEIIIVLSQKSIGVQEVKKNSISLEEIYTRVVGEEWK